MKASLVAALGAGVAIAAFGLFRRYRRDLNAARARLAAAKRHVVSTPWGAVEYAERGSGEPVLVVHGIFQNCVGGLLSVRDLSDRRFIAPSRFGYLGSSIPSNATVADQADAFVALLDALDIGQIDVVGASAGATSALQLALRHPERVKHLAVLVGNLPGSPTAVVQPSWAKRIDRQLIMWALKTFAPSTTARLAAAVPKAFAMTSADARSVTEFIDSLFPMSPEGYNFDLYVSNADVNSYNLEAIRVPTLIIHTKDDQLASHEASKRAAERIPGARFVSLESGGHLMIGQTKAIRGELADFFAEKRDRRQDPVSSNQCAPFRSRRIVVTRYGGPEVLQVIEEHPPEPKPGEARVRILAAGVSYADLLMREGVHPEAPRPPFTVGWDLVGVVNRAGPGVDGLVLNQRVAALSITGGCADYICLPAHELVPVPPDVDLAEAAALVMNYVTAYQMLHRAVRVQPEQRVLIHGAVGGIGTALLELGRLSDLRMYGTGRQADQRAITSLGGTPIDFEHTDFVKEVQRLTGDGVDVVFDGIGGTHVWRSFRTLRRQGTVVAYGLTSTLRGGTLARGGRRRLRGLPTIGLLMMAARLVAGRKKILLYSVQQLKRRRPAFFHEDLTKLFDLLRERRIAPIIAERMPLPDVRQAHERLGSGSVRGKIILLCEPGEHSRVARSVSELAFSGEPTR